MTVPHSEPLSAPNENAIEATARALLDAINLAHIASTDGWRVPVANFIEEAQALERALAVVPHQTGEVWDWGADAEYLLTLIRIGNGEREAAVAKRDELAGALREVLSHYETAGNIEGCYDWATDILRGYDEDDWA